MFETLTFQILRFFRTFLKPINSPYCYTYSFAITNMFLQFSTGENSIYIQLTILIFIIFKIPPFEFLSCLALQRFPGYKVSTRAINHTKMSHSHIS